MKTEVSTLRTGITREVMRIGKTSIIITYKLTYFNNEPIILN